MLFIRIKQFENNNQVFFCRNFNDLGVGIVMFAQARYFRPNPKLHLNQKQRIFLKFDPNPTRLDLDKISPIFSISSLAYPCISIRKTIFYISTHQPRVPSSCVGCFRTITEENFHDCQLNSFIGHKNAMRLDSTRGRLVDIL